MSDTLIKSSQIQLGDLALIHKEIIKFNNSSKLENIFLQNNFVQYFSMS